MRRCIERDGADTTNEGAKLKSEQINAINNMLDNLNRVADDIQLCRTTFFLEDFYGKDGLGKKIDDFVKAYEEQNGQGNAVLSIFIHILKLIKDELGRNIYITYSGTQETGKDIITYLPKVIDWCLEKSFFQQALTLCGERLPEYLVKEGIIFPAGKIKSEFDKYDEVKNKYEKNYYFIAHFNEYTKICKDSKCEELCAYLRNMDSKFTGNNKVLEEDGWKKIWNKRDWNNRDIPKKFSTNDSENLKTCADDIRAFIIEYKKNGGIEIKDSTRDNLLRKFNKKICENLAETMVKLSNNVASKLNLTLNGLYIDKNHICKPYPNLETTEDVIIKILPALADKQIKKLSQPRIQSQKEEYDKILDDLFKHDNGCDVNALKNKYSLGQSEKYYILDAMDMGYIISTKERECAQKILYLYSICKEQRNLSNHAHIKEDDIAVALTPNQLEKVIRELLRLCS
jgi:hypothetical protein